MVSCYLNGRTSSREGDLGGILFPGRLVQKDCQGKSSYGQDNWFGSSYGPYRAYIPSNDQGPNLLPSTISNVLHIIINFSHIFSVINSTL